MKQIFQTHPNRLLLCLLFTIIGGGNFAWGETVTDVLTQGTTGVTGSSYSAWSGKTATSSAIYAGNSAGDKSSIQLRSKNNNSGVVTTTSGGKVKSITVEWNSSTSNGRTLNVYGKNSAYTNATDLYNNSNQGTLLGTIVCGTSTSLTISGDYEYIGFRSASNAMYLTSVSITWETSGGSSAVATPTFSVPSGVVDEGTSVSISCETPGTTIYYTTDGSTPKSSSSEFSTSLVINETQTIKAIAIDDKGIESDVATATYTVLVPVYGYTVDFESNLTCYKDWVFENLTQKAGTTEVPAHGGNYYANTSGQTKASATTKDKVANPGLLKFYISKETTNTTSCSWVIRVSEDGSNWENVKSTEAASDVTKGEWKEVSQDLSGYTDVYVQIIYGTSQAYRAIDDISLELATPKVLSSIALSGEYPTTFHQDDTFSHEGMVVTATYEDESTKVVTDKVSFSSPEMSTTGTKKVTVSYTENEVTRTATYDITVNAPATLTEITLSGSYPTTFEQGDVFSHEGIVVTANYDDGSTSDVTEYAEFSGYDGESLGEQTITVTYNGKTATYTITVVEEKGTAENPYSVADIIDMNPTTTTVIKADIYVKGFIIGSCNTSTGALNTTDVNTNMALSDTPTGTEKYITVALPSGVIRENFNVINNPFNVGVAQVILKADVAKYCGKAGVKNTEEMTKVAEYVTVSDKGYATYYTDCALNFTDTGITAYAGTLDGTKLTFAPVSQVPANEGVLLVAAGGKSATVPVAASAASISNNCMEGTLAGTTLTDNDYILNVKAEGAGFFLAGTHTSLGAHKAYIPAAKGAGVKGFALDLEDNADGIEETLSDSLLKSENIYNLAGQRLSKMQKGINIVNGKKILK